MESVILIEQEQILVIWMLFIVILFTAIIYFYILKANLFKNRLIRGESVDERNFGYAMAQLYLNSKWSFSITNIIGFSSPFIFSWILSYIFIPTLFIDIFNESLVFLLIAIFIGFCLTIDKTNDDIESKEISINDNTKK